LEALEDDRTWGAGILLEQFGDQGLEGVQLAGAGAVGRQGHRGLEILFHRAGGQVEMASDLPHGPMLAASQAVNFIDLVHAQHGPLINGEEKQDQRGVVGKKPEGELRKG
jgi:hypothetical protein